MFDLWLFTTDAMMARSAIDAGIAAIVIDWEYVGKEDRQRGGDFECNRDTFEDLERMRKVAGAKIVCRINAFGQNTADEVSSALRGGADILLLPMVKAPEEVESFLKLVDGRAESGILVETAAAIARARDLAALPVDYVYVGLNDLAISRQSPSIFAAIADGTTERMREVFSRQRFGFGGITLVDRGFPIPCILLMAEMARLRCTFGFLRRSFKQDIQGNDMEGEVRKIKEQIHTLTAQAEHEKDASHSALLRVIKGLSDRQISVEG
jgi:2-keto-3-deoxy-L-rhamnonate aldolase RhmA